MRTAFYPKSTQHTNQHPTLVLILSASDQRYLFQGMSTKERRDNGRVRVGYDPISQVITISQVDKGGHKLGQVWQPHKERSISFDPASIGFTPPHGWGRSKVSVTLTTFNGARTIMWKFDALHLNPLKQVSPGVLLLKDRDWPAPARARGAFRR